MIQVPLDPIKEIIRFQVDRGLDQKPYTPENEHANLVEELFESLGFDVPKENRDKLLLRWMEFVSSAAIDNIALRDDEFTELRVDDIVDAYCDIVVFSIGALMKLGYEPKAALAEAAKVVNSRTGSMVNGKFEKDLSPEAKANWYEADYSKCKPGYVDHSENDSLDYDREI